MANKSRNSQMIINIGQGLSMLVGQPTISTWDSTSRPKNVRRGTFGFNFETNSLEYWDGKSWYAAPMG